MRENAMELLAFLGLANHGKERASNLSYGDQRRLEIARALATQPRLLLLDEPAAGLNPNETAALDETITRIRDRLSITHNSDPLGRDSRRMKC